MLRRVCLLAFVLAAVPAYAQNFTCTLANVCTFSGSQSLWPAGSAAAPTIANSADTDTGIRFPAAGQIAFVVDGTQRLLFESTGLTANVTYFNFGSTGGTTGYGIRDNAGAIEFKNSGGAWTAFVAGGAPTTATYLTQTADASLSAEQALSALSTGIMRVATATGVVTSLTDSAGIFANISDESGSGALLGGTSPTITTPTFSGAIAGSPTTSGAWTFANAGFGIYDTDSSHALRIVPGSNLTATRNFTLTTGDAARVLTMTGDSTLGGNDLSTTGAPTFAGLTLTGTFTANGNSTFGDAVSDTITVTGMFANTSLRVADTNASHALVITPGSNLTADRILTVTTGDVALTTNFTATAAGTFLRSDGTNWAGSATIVPNSATTGDVLYASAANTYANLAAGTSGQVLTSAGAAAPTWSTPLLAPRTITATDFETAARFTDTVVAGGGVTYSGTGMTLTTSATISSSAQNAWNVTRAVNNGGVFSTFPGEFGCTASITAIGTDLQVYLGLGAPTVGGAGITYTVNHIGFKIVRAASGATSLFATVADGTETASSALTTLAADDMLNLSFRVTSASSVSFWWRKNGSAWSSATELTANIPTLATVASATFAASNAGVATATTIVVNNAFYSR